MKHNTFRTFIQARVGRFVAWRHRFETTDATAALPLVHLSQVGRDACPDAIRKSPLALHYLDLLGAIDWAGFPQRDTHHLWPGPEPQSPVPYLVALLMRIDQKQHSMGQLTSFLHHHPELAWLAGFGPVSEAVRCRDHSPAIPTPTQFSQFLRRLPNDSLQFLLDQSILQLRHELPSALPFGDIVSFDTKHILAWVKENNPKTYIKEGRFDKQRQPGGDPDCRLGCKRRTNQAPAGSTPAAEGEPAESIGVGIGEFYWGYASGVVVTRIPNWGEVVLAELTQTFDQSDVSYFFPLMAQVERRLSHRPRFGAGDAAFDAFYVYEYFHTAGGLAAVPIGKRNRHNAKSFTPDGEPLCPAGLPMALRTTFVNRASLIEHDRQRWGCPLLYPQPTGQSCPIHNQRWTSGGCLTTVAASIGARLRYQIERDAEPYRSIYAQRTACERIFSQAVALGIEHPKLRNAASIANLNTLLYVLINLRTRHRIRSAHALTPTG